MTANPKLKIPLVILGALLLIAVCLWVLRVALAPFFAAVVFTYLLMPAHRFLKSRIGQGLSALTVIFIGLVIGAIATWGIVAVFEEQIRRLAASVPQLKITLETRLVPWLQGYPWVIQKIQSALESFDAMTFLRGVSGAGLGVVGWTLQALSLALAPLIAYYMLIDGPRWMESMESLIPPRLRPDALGVIEEINKRLGGFIRGELLVIIAMSFLQGLAFAILGVPYAWLLGLIAGFSNIVPYSPYVTALPIAVLLAAFEGAGWGRITVVALTFFLVQKAEGFYFTPVWVGRASRLHPLEVLLALLCFGFAFGILGLIFAVPLMIVFKVIGKKLIEMYRAHPWFEAE
ncbi:MAG: AI-2E family transporter [Holophagales bacterium]|nr:AI-2E family transporter [Holophagales bacterium]